jgi:hypothetical protein
MNPRRQSGDFFYDFSRKVGLFLEKDESYSPGIIWQMIKAYN